MQKVLTAAEMREVDRQTVEKYGIPFLLLMENAAHAAANVIREKLGGSVKDKKFLILCGKGNNGGDGAALARILWTQGAEVVINLFDKAENAKAEAKTNFEILKKFDSDVVYASPIEFAEVSDFDKWWFHYSLFNQEDRYDCIVDCIFGTGLTKPITSSLDRAISIIRKSKYNQGKAIFVSIDVPSGLNADSPKIIGENFHADLTVTFTAPKPVNVLPPASRFNGELVCVNIGSPRELIESSPSQLYLAEKWDARNWLLETRFRQGSYKNIRGHALLVVGSKNYAGAAVLAGGAALKTGVGLVTIATADSAQNAVAARVLPEVITQSLDETEAGAISETAVAQVLSLSEKMDAVAVGCGLTSGEETTRRFVRALVENRKTPIVIDADGLNALVPFDLQGSDELPIILTPHEGEMRRLLGVDKDFDFSDRVGIAREFAQKHHVILLLKGERSLIAAPDGRVVVNPTGNAGLGKGGSGDTLTGIIVGFLAQAAQMKIDVFETVVAALYVSGLAGDIAAREKGMRSMTASDVRESLAEAFRELENE